MKTSDVAMPSESPQECRGSQRRVRTAPRRRGAPTIKSWTLGPAVAIALVASGLFSPPALAQDTWSTPYTGVRALRRVASGPRRIFAAEIDLCAAGISIRATEPDEARRTVPSFGSATGVEVAVNGDFYNTTTYVPSGRAVGSGEAWGSADSSSRAFVGFGADRILVSPRAEIVEPVPAWIAHGVGASAEILRDGATVSLTSDLCTARHPRTFLGTSADRRTLFLAVVDGRSSFSIGMTCAEGAALMRDLGAANAVNLDGGGSSTFWTRSGGVLNDPSDGTPRVVANHLGIQATGSGPPSSCMPYEPYELSAMAPVLERGPSTDLDGDGLADLCARASAGIRCYRSTGAAFGAAIVGPELSDASGWGDPDNYETILVGDVTGDGLADVCARANAGIRCWPSTGVDFDAPIVGPELSDGTGWSAPRYYATLRMADVDGDGTNDLCARAASGFRCWRSTGTAFEAGATLAALSDAAGFDAEAGWGTIRMGDVDGDGLSDVCARAAGGVDCWRSTGDGFDPTVIAGPRWGSAWSGHETYSTIRLADVDGDGRADLCGRGPDGFRCHLSVGTGFSAATTPNGWTDAGGWADLANYSTIRLADVDGDGDLDVCARANAGIVCHPWTGSGFGASFTGPTLSDASGWGRARYYRTIRFADVDGDGDEDLCARAARGILCWPSEGSSFGTSFDGPAHSDESGWWADRFHSTLRLAGVAPRSTPPPPGPDAGVVASDAGTALDAGVPADGGSSPPARDAGGSADASTVRPDAGPSDPSLPRPSLAGGCNATLRSSSPLSIAATIALWALVRRRPTETGPRLRAAGGRARRASSA